MPGHAKEQTADVELLHGDVSVCLPPPLEVQQKSSIHLAHGPGLGFCKDGVAVFVQLIVSRLPFHCCTTGSYDAGGHLAPVVLFPVHKIVAAIQFFETPVKSGLVFMMRGTKFSKYAIPVRCHDRMNVRTDTWFYMLD